MTLSDKYPAYVSEMVKSTEAIKAFNNVHEFMKQLSLVNIIQRARDHSCPDNEICLKTWRLMQKLKIDELVDQLSRQVIGLLATEYVQEKLENKVWNINDLLLLS